MTPLQIRARALIVGGWALVVAGSVAYFAVLVHQGYFTTGGSLAFDGEVVLPVLGNTAALMAWWWFTCLKVSEEQLFLVQRACYALGIQALMIACAVLCSVSSLESQTSPDQLAATTLIIEAVGGLVVFGGFVVLAGVFTPRRELPREVPVTGDFSGFDADDDEE